jgi:hypothetical protein
MRSGFLVAFLLGCTSTGSLDLELQLPSSMDLRPTGMQTITVLAQSPKMDPIANTAVIDKNDHFAAGDLPVGTDIQVDVLLRDFSSRLVGVGEAPQLVSVAGDQATQLSIPVRRPFVYASSGTDLYTFDPSLDPRDPKFQGMLTGLTSPALSVSVGGDRLVVASGSALQIVDTATHKVTGNPIAIPGMVHDAAPVPGARKVAVAHGGGIAIVDIDDGSVTNVSGPSVDRVTVGPAQDGSMAAYGLVGRILPPAGPLDNCSGSSMMVTVPIDSPPASVTATALQQGTSDLAAAPNTPALFATLPCAGKVVRIDGEISKEVALERAAVLTIAGGRVWAAGSHAATPVCNSGTCSPGDTGTCTSGGRSSGSVAWADPGANLIVESIPLDGTDAPIEINLPERRETMLDKDDPASEHAQVLHPINFEALDLVALPGGQYVSVVTQSTYFTEEFDSSTLIVLPCLLATTGDWLLIDVASASTAVRVRTDCQLVTGRADYFPDWVCADPPGGEGTNGSTYMPTSVGALFGAR